MIVALLVACFIGLLIFVFLEVPLFAVVALVRLIHLAFVQALLVPFVFCVILIVILEKWGSGSLRDASGNADTSGNY